jgi:cytochrome P450
MFTAKLFKEHIWIVVQRNARKLRNVLLSHDESKPVDVFNLMNRFTLDTIGEIGFSKCIGSLDDPSSPFLRSFDRAQQIAFMRFFYPHWRLMRMFGIGSERETREHFSRLDGYSRQVVRDLQSGIAKGDDNEAKRSFVGLFISDAKKRGEHLSEQYLRDLVLNFLIAGRDTTAQALSWTIFCLCRHPEAMSRVRQEVEEVCGVRGPLYEELNRLPYLQAVLNEALRLYPSVPVDMKRAAADDTLPDGTFVPAGTVLLYNLYSMARDTSIWGDDAHTFRPDRWLEMETAPSNYAYPVFNAGPRECLGRRLAQVEMKACLAMLVPHLSFKLAVPEDEVTIDGQLTIGMGRGLPCFIQRVEVGEIENGESILSTTAQSECNSQPSD